MKAKARLMVLLSVPVLALVLGNPAYAATTKNTPANLEQVAADAYVFGYPLVIMEVTKKVLTNTTKPANKAAPQNQFAHIPDFPRPEDREVVRPNVDTLYSFAWLDLSREPVILHLPEMKGRYYLMQMMDAWTNVFASIGTRTTGEQEDNFAIVGPKWQGALPAGVKKLQAPTDTVWIVGRPDPGPGRLRRGPCHPGEIHPDAAERLGQELLPACGVGGPIS